MDTIEDILETSVQEDETVRLPLIILTTLAGIAAAMIFVSTAYLYKAPTLEILRTLTVFPLSIGGWILLGASMLYICENIKYRRNNPKKTKPQDEKNVQQTEKIKKIERNCL